MHHIKLILFFYVKLCNPNGWTFYIQIYIKYIMHKAMVIISISSGNIHYFPTLCLEYAVIKSHGMSSHGMSHTLCAGCARVKMLTSLL